MTEQQEQIAKDLINKRRKLPAGEKLPFAERNIINMYLKSKKGELGKSNNKPGVNIPLDLHKKGF